MDDHPFPFDRGVKGSSPFVVTSTSNDAQSQIPRTIRTPFWFYLISLNEKDWIMIVPEWSLKNMKFGGIFNSSALPASLQLREAATEEDHENRSWKLIPLSYPRAGQQKKKKTATKKQENSHYAIMLLSYIQNHYAGQFWKSPKKSDHYLREERFFHFGVNYRSSLFAACYFVRWSGLWNSMGSVRGHFAVATTTANNSRVTLDS